MLHAVLSDITGVTGLKTIRAILAAERDPEWLAVHRDGRCHASREELIAALTGNYSPTIHVLKSRATRAFPEIECAQMRPAVRIPSACILSDESPTREKLRRGRPFSPESLETVAEQGRHAPKRQVRAGTVARDSQARIAPQGREKPMSSK
jgi:hypothetical protein